MSAKNRGHADDVDGCGVLCRLHGLLLTPVPGRPSTSIVAFLSPKRDGVTVRDLLRPKWALIS